MPVQGAVVTLYVKGKGRIGSEKTSERGSFLFVDLREQPDEYWISIEHDGFFLEEASHLVVFPGLEAVYPPITIESCRPGRCQPHLKTVRVLPRCA